jgi:CRISPR-associated exonuclease Cas4
MFGVVVPRGAIYYGATRKRHEVTFTPELRAHTLGLAEEVRGMLVTQSIPTAPDDDRCPNCSLINACLPGVVGNQDRLRSLQQTLYTPLREME